MNAASVAIRQSDPYRLGLVGQREWIWLAGSPKAACWFGRSISPLAVMSGYRLADGRMPPRQYVLDGQYNCERVLDALGSLYERHAVGDDFYLIGVDTIRSISIPNCAWRDVSH